MPPPAPEPASGSPAPDAPPVERPLCPAVDAPPSVTLPPDAARELPPDPAGEGFVEDEQANRTSTELPAKQRRARRREERRSEMPRTRGNLGATPGRFVKRTELLRGVATTFTINHRITEKHGENSCSLPKLWPVTGKLVRSCEKKSEGAVPVRFLHEWQGGRPMRRQQQAARSRELNRRARGRSLVTNVWVLALHPLAAITRFASRYPSGATTRSATTSRRRWSEVAPTSKRCVSSPVTPSCTHHATLRARDRCGPSGRDRAASG